MPNGQGLLHKNNLSNIFTPCSHLRMNFRCNTELSHCLNERDQVLCAGVAFARTHRPLSGGQSVNGTVNASLCACVCDLSSSGKLSSVRAADTEIPPPGPPPGIWFGFLARFKTSVHLRKLTWNSFCFFPTRWILFYGCVRTYDGELKWWGRKSCLFLSKYHTLILIMGSIIAI